MENILEKIKQFKYAIIVIGLLLIGLFVYQNTQAHATVSHDNIVTAKKSTRSTKQNSRNDKQADSKQVVVDIQGAVQKPGVYHLKAGAIVYDAIKAAGGMRGDADTKQINRAQKVNNSTQIYVPTVGEVKTVSSSSNTPQGNSNGETVNLNSAKVEDFQKVKGIGPKKAAKIIAYREQNGPFQKIDDLSKVGGFGTKTIDSLRDSLTV